MISHNNNDDAPFVEPPIKSLSTLNGILIVLWFLCPAELDRAQSDDLVQDNVAAPVPYYGYYIKGDADEDHADLSDQEEDEEQEAEFDDEGATNVGDEDASDLDLMEDKSELYCCSSCRVS